MRICAGQTGQPYAGLKVYAFDGPTYTGYNGTSDEDGQVTFTLPQGSYRFRADYDGVQFWSGTTNHCDIPGCSNAEITLPGSLVGTNVTIDYAYDGLYRLIQAYYARTGSPGDYQGGYDYEYDRVGNRIYEDAWSEYSETERFYTYDDANRLTGVDETATTYEDLSWEHILSQVENSHSYTWDSNGNLLFDGESYYQYDHASRLVSVSGPSSTVGYAYNGLGDRLQQTVDGATMTYTLDLNTGLTQVLTDGETTYLYGLARLAQENGSTSEYYLGDALGSVRQLIDGSGAVTYAASYTPYGEVLSSAGEGESEFGFTGEQVDATGLVYLRARYYSPYLNQFIQPDTIVPDPYIPADWHKYTYVRNNSINFTDPSGKSINLCLAAVFSPSNIPDNMTAGQLIGICQQFYTPTNWDFDCNYEWSKPEGVGGLFRDYVCEQGPDTVMFNGSDRLTRDLAYSIIIDRIRREYYKGEKNYPQTLYLNKPEAAMELFDVYEVYVRGIVGNPISLLNSIPISVFLGSFDYSVSSINSDRIKIQIGNRTDLASGTHFPGLFPPKGQENYPLSLQEVVDDRNELASWPAKYLVQNYMNERGPIVAILRPLRRVQTIGGMGGGIMNQVFTWTERDLSCYIKYLPYPVYLPFLDIH